MNITEAIRILALSDASVDLRGDPANDWSSPSLSDIIQAADVLNSEPGIRETVSLHRRPVAELATCKDINVLVMDGGKTCLSGTNNNVKLYSVNIDAD